MLKIQHYNDPIYTLEALDLLEKKVNDIKLSNSGDHIDQKVADMIYDDISSIVKGAQIKDPSLYHYFKDTEASIASCLLNSFIAIEKIEQDTFKNDLLEKLAGFNDMHCNGVEIIRRLNIVKGDDKNLLSEILKLDIEDHDKISLIKALEDPKPYVDAIFEDILKIKKELHESDVLTIATGGFSETIAKETDCIDVIDKMLTLNGLKYLYDMNALNGSEDIT